MLVDVIIFGKVNIEEDDLDTLKAQAPIDAAEILFQKGERIGLRVEPAKVNKVPTELLQAISEENAIEVTVGPSLEAAEQALVDMKKLTARTKKGVSDGSYRSG